MAGVEYQVTKVDPTDPETKGMVYQVHKVSEEVAATLGGKVYRARIINDPTEPTVVGKVYQIVLIGDPDDPAVKGKVYNAILTGGSEAVVVGPAVSPLVLDDAIADTMEYVKAYGGTKQGLPDGYTQLEYAESTGTQYIDLGYKGNGTTKIEVKFKYHTATSATGSGRVFGSRTTSSSNAFAIGTSSGVVSATANKVFWCYDAQSFFVVDDPAFPVEDWQTVVFSATEHTLNGVSYGDDYNVVEFETPQNLKLFGFDNGGTMGYGQVDIAYCRLWDNGVLVRDLVPAKNSSNVIGMYDRVSGQFLTNQGTGDFVAGSTATPSPDIPMDIVSNNGVLKARHQSGLPLGYMLLDYIVFDTTQVIDTGFIPDNDSRIESKCYRTGDDCWFYGASPSNPRITLYHSRTGTCRWGYQSRSNVGFVADTEYTIVEDKNGLKINGVDNPWTSGDAGDFTCDRSLTIGNNNGSTGTRYFAGNFYYMKIYDDGVLVRDFVPCKNTSNVVGLYDRVNGVFYTDTGLVAGNTVTDPVEIYTDGTQETIAIIGPNLFDKTDYEEINAYVNANTGVLTQGSPGTTTQYCAVIPCKPNTTYKITGRGTSAWGAFTAKTIGTTATTYDKETGTVTTGASDLYLIGLVRANNDAIDYRNTLSVNEIVSTATAEMLLKVGDYQDVQSIIDGVVTRKVGVKVLDGTESFSSGQASGVQCISIPKTAWGISSDTLPADSLDLICTHYKAVNGSDWTQSKLNTIKVGSGYLFFNTQYVQDSTSFKAYLADQYAAGTPVIVVYPLATATTESVAGQTLQVQDGDNVLEITQASIDGLELEAEYEKEA